MLAPETILQGRYRIIRQLGQGGMGAVYEAIDTRLDTTVALKETLFTDERLRKQFEREARLLARLHHPALPRVSDHFAEEDGEFLVMQYIAGDDLAEMVARRQSPFPAEQVLTWADQLLDALDYLHTQTPQIIHRDIKPQNLKLTPRGQVILLDFGLAKGQLAEVSRVSTASIFGYTPNYAPLEQIQGLGTDTRSDLYALAATLYHLMTGVKPADALTRAAAIVNSQPDPLARANEVNNNIDPSVAAVMEKALSQNKDQRYATAAEMRRALHQHSEMTVSNRSEANTVLFPSAPSTRAVETKANVSAPTAADVLEPTAAAIFLEPTAAANRLGPTAAAGETTVVRQPVGRRRPLWVIPAVAVLLLAIVGGFFAYQNRRSSAEVSAPLTESQPSPTVESSPSPAERTEDAEATAEAEVDKEAEKEAEKAAEKEERKQEQAAQKREAKRAEDQAAQRERDEARQEEVPAHPEVPEKPDVPPPNLPRGSAQTTVNADGTTIRRFPDGTQIVTMPNGRRIVIRPDGTSFVLRPGERPLRRLRRP